MPIWKKNEEIHQIVNWLEELPEFDEHGHTPLSFEALLSFVENEKKMMNLQIIE